MRYAPSAQALRVCMSIPSISHYLPIWYTSFQLDTVSSSTLVWPLSNIVQHSPHRCRRLRRRRRRLPSALCVVPALGRALHSMCCVRIQLVPLRLAKQQSSYACAKTATTMPPSPPSPTCVRYAFLCRAQRTGRNMLGGANAPCALHVVMTCV